MCLLFADVHIYHGNDKYDSKKDQRSSTRVTLVVFAKLLVNITDHGIQRFASDRVHIVTEDTDDAGVFLEASDKAGDNNVSDHGRKKRDRDLGKYAETGCRVDLGGVIVLLIDALKTAEDTSFLFGEVKISGANPSNPAANPSNPPTGKTFAEAVASAFSANKN